MSQWLQQRASRALSISESCGERFARCLMPSPLVFVPRSEPEATVMWVSKPPSGLLTGCIFSDGSAMWPSLPGVCRAGWALIQVDLLGNLLHAAYGPVPLAFGPCQTAKDGEDFAIHMLTQLGIGPFEM